LRPDQGRAPPHPAPAALDPGKWIEKYKNFLMQVADKNTIGFVENNFFAKKCAALLKSY
jgi:hypothetical protein